MRLGNQVKRVRQFHGMIRLRITQQITHLVAYIQHDPVSLRDDLTAITRLVLRHSLGLWMILRPQVESVPTIIANSL